jgi:Uma2 family endonuclease
MSTIARRRITVEEFEAMPSAKHHELVDCQLVRTTMGTESSWVVFLLGRILANHCESNRLGWVFVETAYKCDFSAPNRVRRPDVSFVRLGRIPAEQLPKGFLEIAPHLAVEVLSLKDRAYMVDEKLKQLLGAGVRLVWVVNPDTRQVRVHRADRSITEIHENDELSGEEIVPGFRCRVGDLFPPAPKTA